MSRSLAVSCKRMRYVGNGRAKMTAFRKSYTKSTSSDAEFTTWDAS